MEALIVIIIFSGMAFFKQMSGKDWTCFFGLHRHHQIGEKHGMYFDSNSGEVVGTRRKIFQCRCGHIKCPEPKDYVGN